MKFYTILVFSSFHAILTSVKRFNMNFYLLMLILWIMTHNEQYLLCLASAFCAFISGLFWLIVVDLFNFFGQCRGIDFSIASHEVPNRSHELPSLIKRVMMSYTV